MDDTLRTGLWRQFGAAIDYFGDTLRACPESLWTGSLWAHSGENPIFSQFWYRAYHTLFWLDLHLYGSEEGYLPPPPFELIEQDDEGPIPARPYTREELLAFLAACRDKCRTTILAMTTDTAHRRHTFNWGEASYFELLLYSLRHVQEHASQLNLIIGQQQAMPDYPARAWEDAPWRGRPRD